jgi:hypothetical protein
LEGEEAISGLLDSCRIFPLLISSKIFSEAYSAVTSDKC